jgi:hypothetical protein
VTDHIFYPDLKIVPLSKITLQEHVKENRMHKLVDSIQKEGVLRNPPIVTNFSQGTYLHLDGANRITAMSLLQYPNCLVQVVDYSDPTHIHLSSWSHLIHVDKKNFLAQVGKLPEVSVKESSTFDPHTLLLPKIACVVVFRDSGSYEITFDARFHEIVNGLNDIVNLYIENPVERVYSGSPWNAESIQNRFERYPENNALVIFPTYSPQQIVGLVDKGVLLPAGVTRHVVYRRKLNVNLPLDFLKITDMEEANRKLQEFLQHRTVRLYEEPIIYFE